MALFMGGVRYRLGEAKRVYQVSKIIYQWFRFTANMNIKITCNYAEIIIDHGP